MFARNGIAGIEDLFSGLVQTIKVGLPLYTQYVQVKQARAVAAATKEQAIAAKQAAEEAKKATSAPSTPWTTGFPWGTLALGAAAVVLVYMLSTGGQRKGR